MQGLQDLQEGLILTDSNLQRISQYCDNKDCVRIIATVQQTRKVALPVETFVRDGLKQGMLIALRSLNFE